MSFIDQTKQGTVCVCLEKEDCELLLKAAEKVKDKAKKQLVKWSDIHDSGEITTRQQTAFIDAEEKFARANGIVLDMKKYLEWEGGEQ